MARKNDDQLLIRLPKELRQKAQEMAERQERPLAWIVRKMLEKKVQEEQRKEKQEA